MLLATSAVKAFQPPSQGLATALHAVITNHPAVKSKQAELDALGYDIDAFKALRYPTLSAEISYLDDGEKSGVLQLQQPLWAFGKIDIPIERAKAAFVAEKLDLLRVKRQLIEETAVAYGKVQGIRQRERVAREDIAEHTNFYQRIERRQKGQLASETDVRLAYSRLIQARARLERVLGELRVALTELQTLTQIKVETDTAVDLTLLELPAESEIGMIALEKNVEVRQKRELLNLAGFDVEKEKAAIMPTLFFRVNHEFIDADSLGNDTDDTRYSLNLEGSMDGLGLGVASQVDKASARRGAALHELNVMANDLQRRIAILVSNRRVQQELTHSQKESIAAIKATMESFVRQYDAGRKSWVELLNMQRELTEQRLQLVQIENDWLIFSLKIIALMGGLDELSGVEAI